MPIARLLGEEKKLVINYWLDRLKDLPNGTETPLDKRLSVRDDGLLSLDLEEMQIADLSPLSGMPLGALTISKCAKVTDLSPLRGMPLTAIDISRTGIDSLEPLRGMNSLQKLFISSTKVSDLSPLAGLKLNWLEFDYCPVISLAPLREMPLEQLKMLATAVTDLSPLANMPLKILDVSGNPVQDFKPLTGMPLEVCLLQGVRVGDLAFLKGTPLKQLALMGSVGARNLAVLSEIRTLEVLTLPDMSDLSIEDFTAVEAFRNHPSIKQLADEIPIAMKLQNISSKDDFWKNWDRNYAWQLRLRKAGFNPTVNRIGDGTWAVSLRNNKSFSDLTLLSGAAISWLDLYTCRVSDLTPLKELPLKSLDLGLTRVSDIASLRGMKLQWLSVYQTAVHDLSPLSGMPLQQLDLRYGDQQVDLRPLSTCTGLENVFLPVHVTDLEPLRKLPKLKRMSFSVTNEQPTCTAAAFWKSWDGLPSARKLEEAGIEFELEQTNDGFYELRVHDPKFTDCSIFKGTNVRRLDLDRSGVTDLSPLADLPLVGLWVRETAVTDLAPLRSSTLGKSLRELRLWKNKVTDFSPIATCTKLEIFDTADTQLADLSILKGMPLRALHISRTLVTDISVLAGMPLESLHVNGTPIDDLSPLVHCPKLVSIVLSTDTPDIDLLRTLPGLKRISYNANTRTDGDTTAAEFWAAYQPWKAKLVAAGITVEGEQLADGFYSVKVHDGKFTDCSAFKGLKLHNLTLTKRRWPT